MNHEWIIRPACAQWNELIARKPVGSLGDRTLEEWRTIARTELRLATDRPVIATGHQTLLWHPGILAKYLVTDAFARANNLATANLVVDQHVGDFGAFEIPVRKPDGSLGVRKLELCKCRDDVPMGRHDAFTPLPAPDEKSLSAAIPSVAEGVRKIFSAADAHRNAPNAALQMAAAIADLIHGVGNQTSARPMPDITATALINTSLARAIMQQMVDHPRHCAECYNRAVATVPEAGIGPLAIRDDYVELPVWRVGNDWRRIRGYDNDVERAMEELAMRPSGHLAIDSRLGVNRQMTQSPNGQIDLLPRALFMTALVRLGMCDLFIHGTGGAAYDRAMEVWIKEWLGLDVGSIAVVSATMRLPLMAQGEDLLNVDSVVSGARRLWHDPEPSGTSFPTPAKRRMVDQIEALPRNSPKRKAAFLAMHEQLEQMRAQRRALIEQSQRRIERAKQQAADWRIAQRRNWAFALYPAEMIEELADGARKASAGFASARD